MEEPEWWGGLDPLTPTPLFARSSSAGNVGRMGTWGRTGLEAHTNISTVSTQLLVVVNIYVVSSGR